MGSTPVKPGDPNPFDVAGVEPTEGNRFSDELPGEVSELGPQWRRFSERPGVEEHVRSRWDVEEEDDDDDDMDAIRDPVGLQVLRDESDGDGWRYLVLDGPAMGCGNDGYSSAQKAAAAGDRVIAEAVKRSSSVQVMRRGPRSDD